MLCVIAIEPGEDHYRFSAGDRICAECMDKVVEFINGCRAMRIYRIRYGTCRYRIIKSRRNHDGTRWRVQRGYPVLCDTGKEQWMAVEEDNFAGDEQGFTNAAFLLGRRMFTRHYESLLDALADA